MAVSKKKEETRARIIEAAGKGIKLHGYGGIGVDGIAKEAGVTSGAFYGHFGSKEKVFEASVSEGMKAFVDCVHFWRESKGENWLNPFIDWYLCTERCKDIAGGCALPGLSADVSRAEKNVHAAYEEQLVALIDAVAEGIPGKTKPARKKTARALLAILAGAVMMTRAIESEELAEDISNAARVAAKKIAEGL
ncbi:MAG: TetR/AcrR family transcriptional regulator [Pseudomonadales bacterium]